ncbi:MAG: DUF6249 domain-containing protein [Myxococcota bacterium]
MPSLFPSLMTVAAFSIALSSASSVQAQSPDPDSEEEETPKRKASFSLTFGVDEDEDEGGVADRILDRVRKRMEDEGLSAEEITSVSDALSTVASELDRGLGSRSRISIDPAIVERLQPDQLERLLLAREEVLKQRAEVDGDPPLVALLIPFAAFLFVLGLVAVPLWFRNRNQLDKQETLRLMVEKGADIPPGLLATEERPRSDLRRGVILISTGIGVSLFLRIVENDDSAWSLGIVPFAIGVGYLLTHWLEREPSGDVA